MGLPWEDPNAMDKHAEKQELLPQARSGFTHLCFGVVCTEEPAKRCMFKVNWHYQTTQ